METAWVKNFANYSSLSINIKTREDVTEAQKKAIAGTGVYGQWTFPYYSAPDYAANNDELLYANKNFRMDYQDKVENHQAYLMEITADYFYIYDNIWIDTSVLRTFNFATIYNAYIPDTAWP